jgi:hypothetical protein
MVAFSASNQVGEIEKKIVKKAKSEEKKDTTPQLTSARMKMKRIK